jgi:t-SNARE complex subunit (syntaxin)
VEGIQGGLKELQLNINEIEGLENRVLSTIVESEQKRLRKELELMADGTSRLALLLRQRLKRMESTASEQQSRNPQAPSNLRMCLTQVTRTVIHLV